MTTPTEETILSLGYFINGLAPYPRIFRGFFHTYPYRTDDLDLMHAACIELEKRGQILLLKADDGHFVWMPTDETSGAKELL